MGKMHPNSTSNKIFKRVASIILITCFAFITVPTKAQNAEDTTDKRFHDDLLNHLVGKWNVASIAHGYSSTAVIEAEWILNHQHFRIHFKGNEVIPWIGAPMEFDYFIGYNRNNKRYVFHSISVFGNDDEDGFWYGYRIGNEIKIIQNPNVQRLFWEPASNSWNIQSRAVIDGKEGEVFLDMKLTAVKSLSK